MAVVRPRPPEAVGVDCGAALLGALSELTQAQAQALGLSPESLGAAAAARLLMSYIVYRAT